MPNAADVDADAETDGGIGHPLMLIVWVILVLIPTTARDIASMNHVMMFFYCLVKVAMSKLRACRNYCT